MTTKTYAWSGGACRVPMWMSGSPAGFCGDAAYGPQLPRSVLVERSSRYLLDRPAYCHGPCCPAHGGPKQGEPIVFQDGLTKEGRIMWCAVMPDFQNLQESPAGFDRNALVALRNLEIAVRAAAR